MDFKQLYTSADGRIGRKTWWIGFLIIFAVGIAIGLVLQPVGWFASLLGLILMAAAACVHIKRFHDRGRSGWWVLGVFAGSIPGIPAILSLVILIWIIVDLGILKGDEGDNQYGPDPVA